MVRRVAKVGKKRPRRILPVPPPRHWLEIIDEVRSPHLGAELALLARQARVAGEAGAAHWPSLFVSHTALHVGERRAEALAEAVRAETHETELPAQLRVVMRLVGRQQPAPAELCAACEMIARWAQDAGYASTAVQFAEAAALVCHDDAYASFVAGRTNRFIGEPWRAEIFYGRAIRIAYARQNWSVYIRAHLGFGRLEADRGRFAAAAVHLRSAARMALDQGEEWLAAQTYHDMVVLYYEQEEYGRAAEAAQTAIRIYPRHHERFPIAVHDFIYVALVDRGHYEEALPVVEALAQAPLRPHDQVFVLGTLARTAGSLGLHDRFGFAETRLLSLAPHYDLHAPYAFLNLAAGARELGDWELAEQYARKGVALAEARGLRRDVERGTALVREIAAKTRLSDQRADGRGVSPAVAQVVAELCGQVAGWRTETWTMKERQSGVATLGPV